MESTYETSAIDIAMLDQTQFLTFFMGGEEYAIEILQVKEIIEFGMVTRVPGVPASVRGVINLRGSVVPVIDLAVKFALPPIAITKQTCVVIVEVDQDGEKIVMGVLADRVSEVMTLSSQEIQPPPSLNSRIDTDSLKGLGKVGKKFFLILNVDKILSVTELMSLSEIEAPGKKTAVISEFPGKSSEGNGISSEKEGADHPPSDRPDEK